jgi:hypothetical protein
MKSEKVVMQGARCEVQKSDLISNAETSIRVSDLVMRQARFPQQGFRLNARFLQLRIGEPRNRPVGARKAAETPSIRTVHDSPLRFVGSPDRLARMDKALADRNKTPAKSRAYQVAHRRICRQGDP